MISKIDWVKLNMNAKSMYDEGQYNNAKLLIERSLFSKETMTTEINIEVAVIIQNLGLLYHRLNDFTEAESLYKKSLEIKDNLLERDHFSIILTSHNLVCLYVAKGEYESAQFLYESLSDNLAKLRSINDEIKHDDILDIFAEASHERGYEVKKIYLTDWSYDFDDRDAEDWESHYQPRSSGGTHYKPTDCPDNKGEPVKDAWLSLEVRWETLE